jgi:hypothetical protein
LFLVRRFFTLKKEEVNGVPTDWITKTAKMAKEMDKYREEAIRLDRVNELVLPFVMALIARS